MDRRPCLLDRRGFLARAGLGLGPTALAALLAEDAAGAAAWQLASHVAPKAKRVIFLFQAGGPSQLDLFDPKPVLVARHGEDLPESVRGGQRLTGMTARQARFPLVASPYRFAQRGPAGAWFSELLPCLGAIADRLCIVKSVVTEAINHDPAITFLTTGAQLAGRPSLGAWLSYGLGSANRDLPAFVVMTSRGTGKPEDQPLYDRLWGSGFLPSEHQGVKFRSQGDPVLHLSNPAGIDRSRRRDMLDDVQRLNRLHRNRVGDPEIDARIAQYELAFRMQASAPELVDVSGEPQSVLDLYGPEAARPGTFAANCLLARRLSERGVRFVQLFHMGWDQHLKLSQQLPQQARDVDQPSAALVKDLEQRGLLDETLVVWGGEFGRTAYCQGEFTAEGFGRDHHPRCFAVWLAGGGVKAGWTHGETDDFSYNVTRDPVHVHDLNATILHLLGIDHTRLTYKFQGRHFRLTDVHGTPVRGILA